MCVVRGGGRDWGKETLSRHETIKVPRREILRVWTKTMEVWIKEKRGQLKSIWKVNPTRSSYKG